MSVDYLGKLAYVTESLERLIARETENVEAIEKKLNTLPAGERAPFAFDQVGLLFPAMLRRRYFQEVLRPLKENRTGMAPDKQFEHLFKCVARDVAVGAGSGHSTSWLANAQEGVTQAARGEVLRLFLNLG